MTRAHVQRGFLASLPRPTPRPGPGAAEAAPGPGHLVPGREWRSERPAEERGASPGPRGRGGGGGRPRRGGRLEAQRVVRSPDHGVCDPGAPRTLGGLFQVTSPSRSVCSAANRQQKSARRCRPPDRPGAGCRGLGGTHVGTEKRSSAVPQRPRDVTSSTGDRVATTVLTVHGARRVLGTSGVPSSRGGLSGRPAARTPEPHTQEH